MQTVDPRSQDDSWTRLVDRHGAGVLRYLRSMVGDEDAARDLVQETFLKLRGRADEPGPGLVYTAARSCAIDHLRRQGARRMHEVACEPAVAASWPARQSDNPDTALEEKMLRGALLEALAALTEDQRTVFHLSEIEGLPYARIAEVLGVPPGTIASRKHHAVLKLRDHLRRLGHDA